MSHALLALGTLGEAWAGSAAKPIIVLSAAGAARAKWIREG